jgi:hypothetical protein
VWQSRRDEIDGVSCVEVEGDVVACLVDVDSDVEIVVFGEVDLVEEPLLL